MKKYSLRKVLSIRLKQLATTAFVIVTSTLMIQNVWYPEAFSAFKKTWRAGVGAVIFLMGFAVARALFDIYGEQVRQIKAGAFATRDDAAETGSQDTESVKTFGAQPHAHEPENADETGGTAEPGSQQP